MSTLSMVGKAGIAAGVGFAAASFSPVANLAGTAIAGNMPGSNNLAGGELGSKAFGAAVGGATFLALNPKAIGTAAITTMQAVGSASIGAMELLGGGIIKSAPYVATGAGMTAIAASRKYGAGLAGLADKMVVPLGKERSGFEIVPYKLSKLGMASFIGAGLIGGARDAFDSFNRNRMGQNDGQIMRAAPRTPSYANNGGATGDLVFAMNNNRRG